jgi:hypothetical protein
MRKKEEMRWRTVDGGGDDMREIRWREKERERKGKRGKDIMDVSLLSTTSGSCFPRRFFN